MHITQTKQTEPLEEKIFKSLNKAMEYLESNPALGARFLIQANRLYNKLGYNFNVNCRINEVCFAYMPYAAERYHNRSK